MALPIYATFGQRVWHYTYLGFCGFVLFFLPSVALHWRLLKGAARA